MNYYSFNISKITRPAGLLRLSAIALMAVALISTLAGMPVASAQAPQNEVHGFVRNGTDPGQVPEGMTILLMSIDDAANQIIEQETTTVAADGSFGFGNLISGPGVTFRVVADAGNYTPSIDLTDLDDWSDVRLTVYDETLSLENITVSSYVMMVPTIDARSRQAGILSVVNVNNSGNTVWVPDLDDPSITGLDLLRFNLPDGFSDLSVESELPAGNILEIDTGFAMTNPIPPGEAAILMSYILPYSGDGFDFGLKLPYGADVVRMLLPDEGGTITGDGLGGVESVVVADSVFNSVEGNDYPAGDEITVKFTGLPQPTPFQSLADFFDGRTYIIVIIWIVGVALLGILGFAMYSSRRSGKESSTDDGELATRADIVAEIAQLDEEHAAGKIDDAEYEELRDELKQMALDIEDKPVDDSTEEPSAKPEESSVESEDSDSEKPDK